MGIDTKLLKREIVITGSYDKRHADPKKNYGIHGMEIRFFLSGKEGAVQFVVFTPMYVESARQHLSHFPDHEWRCIGADIGYHSPKPKYESQHVCDDKCEFTGGPCYYDGSGLAAEEFMPKFLAGGSDAVWSRLEEEYIIRFGEDNK